MEEVKFYKNKLIIILVLIFFSSCVLSFSVVTPASYDLDFSSKLNQEFIFRFGSDESDLNFFISGDLKDYATLDVRSLRGQYLVVVSLRLPDKLEKPGINVLRVTASPFSTSGDQVSIVSSPSGLIRVRVPYPGRYAELDFSVSSVNQGQDAPFSLTVYSRGDRNIVVTPFIEIYEREKVIGRLDLDVVEIKSGTKYDYISSFNTKNLAAGNYLAKAVVEYGGERPSEASASFRLGELFVDIFNYTNLFERNKINRFEIEIESFWNDPINEVYAQVEILGHPNNFLTPTIRLSPWQKSMLTGFLDTTGIESDYFDANITIYYGGKQNSRIVRLNFKPEFNYMNLIWIGLAIIIIILLLVIIILILLKKNRK